MEEKLLKEENNMQNDFLNLIITLKEQNELNIEKMRPYKHLSPYDFGVLNGIDEAYRKILEELKN